MADGSQVIDRERAARAAASDAAAVARAEVMEQAAPTAPTQSRAKSRAAATKAAKPDWHEFIVDVWLTNFNSVEFGVYKHSRNKAKSRQFTSDMDIFAEVIENGERTGLLGYREELWQKNAGMDKRLVFKLFNETLNWRATMDFMVARSLQLTLGARGIPVLAFSLNVNNADHMVYLERSANKWPLMPEHFSFFIMSEGRPVFYRLRRDLIDFGGDFTLYNEQNEQIGRLNGRVFTLGGYWKGRIAADKADKTLIMVLQLFCGMLCFRRPALKHARTVARAVRRGEYVPKLEKQEIDLYMNPRRVR
jgi:hypothetical protein